MKKIIAVMLVLVLCLALTACGGPDLEAASAAYTKASTAFNEVAVAMNENIGAFGEDEVNLMTEMAATLEEMKVLLETGDLTQEQVDEATAWFGQVYDNMQEFKAAYGIE